MRETSLEDFSEGTEGSRKADSGDDGAGTDSSGDDGAGTKLSGDPGEAASTYAWTPEGRACPACGSVVERRWRDGEELVCVDCVTW